MDPLDTVRRRLVEQRLAGEPFAAVDQAVGWLGAVQAQELAETRWSLAERTVGCSEADVEAALARGDIVRTHVLRPTWHLVARADLRWLLRLTRPRVHALNRYWYRRLELDAGVLARGHAVLAGALADGEALTRRELAARLAAGGIPASGLQLAYLLMHAELEELVCSGPSRGKQQTYALVDSRVATSPLDGRPRERALDELVLRYFRSHGPATVKDFTTWSSLTVAEVRTALERVGDALEYTEDERGTAWYAAPSPASARSSRVAGAFLLAMYDEMIVAYQDVRVVPAREPPRTGLLDRAVVVDGRTVGSWKRTLSTRSVVVEATLFGALAPAGAAALDDVVERFGRFLGRDAALETRLAA